jgi:hypothetical protein
VARPVDPGERGLQIQLDVDDIPAVAAGRGLGERPRGRRVPVGRQVQPHAEGRQPFAGARVAEPGVALIESPADRSCTRAPSIGA